ncbi:hypothetical protein P152DRAFT_458333 [Eremomyces bilateralis CBS 781.70]|uniref:Uncharacterized protein n=1 Tax=Eremomyces bilateralis CBS 781.70 TaxID=1392243 RepID=A0A6G1G3K2_9PEZI|nr:uncharacterized protein P152DRAFT_458333 [Eremomyces bilateralis CBS 781.70]KAF1812490.1 hypothetical protein P152DRAFT_458333 [Eremomyces bilateralis CBS 781.70]
MDMAITYQALRELERRKANVRLSLRRWRMLNGQARHEQPETRVQVHAYALLGYGYEYHLIS